MNEYLKQNGQFLIMLLVWVAAGFVAAPLATALVPLSVIMMKRKNMFPELIIGFIFILILSDSRQYQLDFAKNVKNIYIVLLALFYFFGRKDFPFKNTFFLAFIPFIIWSFLMILKSPDISTSFQKTLSYALLFIVAPAYFYKAFYDSGPIFLKNLIMLASIILSIGLLLIPLNPNFVFLAGRYNGLLGNPNGIGIFCVLLIILLVCSRIKFPELFTRNELIYLYIVIGLSVILCGSRNTLMCIFIFLFFTRFYKISYWYGFIAMIVAVILYQTVFANLPTILEALGLAKSLRSDSIENGSGRIVAWMFALKHLYTNINIFIFGGGFSYDEYIFYVNRHALSALGHQGGVHNSYLAIWLNTGIIGLGLWLAGFLRNIFKALTITYTALPLMYAVMFSAFFEAWLMGSLNPYTSMFLLIFTLVTTDNNFFKGYRSEDVAPITQSDTVQPELAP